MKKKFNNMIIIILFAAGLLIFLYPVASDFINSRLQGKVVRNYGESVAEMKEKEIKKELQKAQKYNESIGNNDIADPFNNSSNSTKTKSDYNDILNIDGVMGQIEIPKIDVNLPIYHGTSEESMKKGVGHMIGTSLPIGGKGTHSILSAHRGLPTAKLFTDLDKLEIGDMFYIKVLNKTLAYKVDQIKVVKPQDTRDLSISKDKDYVTLVTCTPYGINSHRLLVRGERTSYVKPSASDNKKINYLVLILLAVLILLIIFIVFRRIQKRKN